MIRTIHSNRLVNWQVLEDLAKISDTGNSEIIKKENWKFIKERITSDYIAEWEENKFLTPEKEDLILNSENIKNKGKPNGYAGLDETWKVPSSQLPWFVDDVLEFENLENFPYIWEKGKLYVSTQNNKTYRWSWTQYIEIVSTIWAWKWNFSENDNYIKDDKVFFYLNFIFQIFLIKFSIILSL